MSGAGHIRKRGANSWELRWPLPAGPDGKRRIGTETFKGSQRDASQLLAQRVAEADTGMAAVPGKLTFGEWCERWLSAFAGDIKPITRQWNSGTCRLYLVPALGAVRLRDLSPLHIKEAFTLWQTKGRDGGRPLARSSLGQVRIVLSACLSAAVRLDLLARNPLDRLKGMLPTGAPAEAQVMDSARVAELIEAARGTDYHIAVMLCATLGLRRGEACGLRWRNLDLVAGSATISEAITPLAGGNVWGTTKTGKSRILALPRLAIDELQRHRAAMAERMLALGVRLDGNHTAACHGDGTPLRPDALTRWCSKHFGKLHTLRHSHASALLNAGVSITTVADRLGHQRVTTTLETYAHTMPGADRDAAEKIDQLLSGSKTAARQR